MNAEARTVFVVDDTREVRVALSRILSAAGYQVRSFESASVFLRNKTARRPAVCSSTSVCRE